MGQTESERFWSKVDTSGDCWLWTAATQNGYGKFRLSAPLRQQVYAHRWAYESEVGAIPEGLQLDHLCRVRSCVRPDHLEPVTGAVNVGRSPIAPTAVNRRKTHCINGHPLSGDNLYVDKAEARQCRTCMKARHAAWEKANRRNGLGKGGYWAAKTHCPQGHPYDEENTLVRPATGARVCRICLRESKRRYKARQRQSG